MRFYVVIAFCVCFLNTFSIENEKQLTGIIDRYFQAHNNFLNESDVWGNYTIDLNIEAIINYTLYSGDSCYIPTIDRFFLLRKYSSLNAVSFEKTPFCDAYYSYFLMKSDSGFVKPYIESSYEIKRNAIRSTGGEVYFVKNESKYLLIDFIQNYISRMARAGKLSGDLCFFSEACNQIELYRKSLQYKDSKLFSQGKGWLIDRNELSPSAWLRGQGWMMRAYVNLLTVLPSNSGLFKNTRKSFVDFVNGLLKLQSDDGMWYNLPLYDDSISYPEVSGSAMISYYLLVACNSGILTESKFSNAAIKTRKEIHKYINPDYSVRNVSPGPGTLFSVNEYKSNAETDNPHGVQAVILLLSINPD